MRRLALALAAVASLAACVDTYCQSGSKYGTQCRTGLDVQLEQRQQGRTQPETGAWFGARPTPPPAATAPAPPSSSFFSPAWQPPQPVRAAPPAAAPASSSRLPP